MDAHLETAAQEAWRAAAAPVRTHSGDEAPDGPGAPASGGGRWSAPTQQPVAASAQLGSAPAGVAGPFVAFGPPGAGLARGAAVGPGPVGLHLRQHVNSGNGGEVSGADGPISSLVIALSALSRVTKWFAAADVLIVVVEATRGYAFEQLGTYSLLVSARAARDGLPLIRSPSSRAPSLVLA